MKGGIKKISKMEQIIEEPEESMQYDENAQEIKEVEEEQELSDTEFIKQLI